MSETSSGLRYGRIVYAWIADQRGYAKLRPALVLTPTPQILPERPVIVAAITTTFSDPPPRFCVPLPWHPNGVTSTKLRARSAVVINWLTAISPSDAVGFGGDVPAKVMGRIQRLIDELEEI